MNDLKRDIIKAIKKYKPERIQFANLLSEIKKDPAVYRIFGPVKKRRRRKLPDLPTMDQVRQLLDVIEKDGKLKYRLMVKMLLYTGMRRSELVNLLKSDVSMVESRIKIRNGKGGKDRIIPIFREIRENLLLYMDHIPYNKFLFENRNGGQYTGRWIGQIFQDYRAKIAEFPDVTPHTMRHVFATFLAKQGWSTTDLMMILGHENEKSTDIYRHLSIADIEGKFQSDMNKMGV